MKSVNKVILLGLFGHDPEVKYTANGVAVARFSLATNERFKKKTGKFQDRTEWHNIVVWRKLAEIVAEFVSKGSHLYIEGKLQTTGWEDRQSAEKKYRTEIVANDLVLLGSREKENEAQPAGSHKAEKAKPSARQLALLRRRTIISRFESALRGVLRLHCDSMADRFEETEVLVLP